MSFEEAYKNYLIYASRRHKKQSFDTISYKFNLRILPFFKNYNIEDIASNDILSWQNYISTFNFTNNYNSSLYYILSSFFEYCSLFYNFDKTIISKVGNFRKHYEENKKDFYNLKEFNLFIKNLDNNIYKQFFNLMFFTGTRPGEAMALKFSDLHDDYIFINKTISEHGNREIGTPKTSSSVRKIRIDNVLKNDLLKLKKYYEKVYNKSNFDFYIFGGMKPLAPTTINRYKFNACKKANLRSITLHQFRHSHATLLLHNGIIINEISRRLGHSNPSITFNIYTHTDLSQEKRVSTTLNSLRFNLINTISYKFNQFICIITHFFVRNNHFGADEGSQTPVTALARPYSNR